MLTFPRYDSYKESDISWLGEIPEHWLLLKNKFLFQEKKDAVGQNARDYPLLSLTLRGVIARDMENPQGKFPAEFNTYKIVNTGDLIFCHFDVEETPRTVGIAYQDGMITGAYTILKCVESVNPKYLYYYYLYLDFDKQLRSLYTGLRKVIQRGTFLGVRSPVPPRAEQDRIVTFLDEKTAAIDDAIAKKRRLIELLQEQKGILINTAVTQGLDPNVPMKESGVEWIGRVPAHWEVLPMKRIVCTKITDGPHETPKFVDAGIPFLSVEAAFDGRLHLDKARGFISENDHEKYSAKVKPQMEDIFIVKSGSTTGKVVIVDFEDEFSIWSPLALVRPKPELFDAQFLFISLQDHYFQNQVQTSWSKGTQPNIGMGDLEKLLLIKPPLVEQADISKLLEAQFTPIHLAISKSFEEINLLDEFRTVLIAEVVTGKIKV